MTSRPRLPAAFVFLGLILPLATPAHSQAFRALVRDSATGRPLEGAVLRILDSTGNKLAERLTNQAGLVTGEVLDEATVYFAVLRIGYRPFLSQPVALGPAASVSLAFNLASRAIPLPDLEVRAYYASALDRTGFWEREREGFGHFVDPAATERMRETATHFMDYLRNIPGVTMVETGSGRVLRLASGGSVNGGCGPPKIYVDGISMDTGSLDTIIQPGDVLAIEVYRRPAELPAGYGGAQSGCGVLLIWSRRGVP